jgi:hypothetical protein
VKVYVVVTAAVIALAWGVMALSNDRPGTAPGSGGAVPVGTVIESMLDYSEFAREVREMGPFDPARSKWCPADGRPVDGSAYARYKKEHLPPATQNVRVPDMRGLFSRCVNTIDPQVPPRQDGFLDTDNRNGGDLQRGDIGPHSHPLTKVVIEHPKSSDKQRDGASGGGNYSEKFGFDPSDENCTQTSNNSGKETRPNNMAVYLYIRIN